MGLSAHLLRCHSNPQFETSTILVYGHVSHIMNISRSEYIFLLLDDFWPDCVALSFCLEYNFALGYNLFFFHFAIKQYSIFNANDIA